MSEIINIVNAKVWVKGKILEGGITIIGDRIAKIGKESALKKAERTFDAGGRLLLPGFIDVHTHLRDFELSYKEDFSSGTTAAVAGGFTTVLDMSNNKPPTMTPEIVRARIQKAEGNLFCDVGFYATPRSPKEVDNLVDSGCIAMKIYMSKPLDYERYSTEREIIELIKKTSSAGIVLSVHAEDPNMIKRFKGDLSPELHARSHPIKAEERAIDMVIRASKISGGKLHICHVSTLEGLNKIKSAKRKGVDVTCEATPHHTVLTNEVFEKLGKKSIVEPPLRSKRHMEAILKGISKGDVDILATDHAPHTLGEKDGGSPGFPGLETAVPIFFTLVRDGLLTLDRVIDAFTINPAERFSLPDAGKIEVGRMANLTMINLKSERKIDSDKFFSKSKFSPFDGMVVKACVHATFIRGRAVFLDGEIVSSKKAGKILHG
ncbi:MAG: dihydroorotase family protein [Candidatus Methylarchaceae archaeon HK01B]|nr:dihydroorotase family protein [Candidatus Methylarchaceae archaeon HK01B]